MPVVGPVVGSRTAEPARVCPRWRELRLAHSVASHGTARRYFVSQDELPQLVEVFREPRAVGQLRLVPEGSSWTNIEHRVIPSLTSATMSEVTITSSRETVLTSRWKRVTTPLKSRSSTPRSHVMRNRA